MNQELIKINQFMLENRHIKRGSYSTKQTRRIIGSWTDGNGITHTEYYPTTKAVINFVIIERSAKTQNEINDIFLRTEDIEVEYYDTISHSVKQGIFRMTEPELRQKSNGDPIWYDETKITLTEH